MLSPIEGKSKRRNIAAPRSRHRRASSNVSGRLAKSRNRAITSKRPAHVIGPFGEKLTVDRLPASATVRWTVRRKAEVVAAVRGGLLTFDEACARYKIAMEELVGWQSAVEISGMRGLRTTRSQEYRELFERRHR